MFRGLINDAKSAAGSMLAKYLARASVAVPFLVAAGFGTAALTVVLVEWYGATTAYLVLAGGFTLIGLAATLFVTVKEQEEVIAEQKAVDGDTAAVASDATAQAAAQLPIAALGALFTTPGGPMALAGGLRALGRNIPLVVLLVLIGMLFWPVGQSGAAAADETDGSDDREAQASPLGASPEPERFAA